MSDGDRAVYLYGVVAASASPPSGVVGVAEDGEPVRLIAGTEVAVLASDLQRGPIGRARDMRAHWRVLEEASKHGTVIPLRFGTVMESDAAVREDFIAPNEARLEALLAELRDKVQLTVRAFYDEERVLLEIARDTPPVRQLSERLRELPEAATYYDRIRLGELVADELERRRQGDTDLVLSRLGGLAVAAKAEQQTTKDTAVNAAFLVERGRVDEFSEAVRRLHGEVGDRMRIRYVGPLPPYSFAGEELAGSAAWG